jgi:hypothetical protein
MIVSDNYYLFLMLMIIINCIYSTLVDFYFFFFFFFSLSRVIEKQEERMNYFTITQVYTLPYLSFSYILLTKNLVPVHFFLFLKKSICNQSINKNFHSWKKCFLNVSIHYYVECTTKNTWLIRSDTCPNVLTHIYLF